MARKTKPTATVPPATRSAASARYDAHHSVLSRTYGALADLRRELSDSKAAVAERSQILQDFATCADSQRAWLLLEDYFEKLSLSRKDFLGEDWWPRMLDDKGRPRLESVAYLFLKSKRSLPTELLSYANTERFAAIEAAEAEARILKQLEQWMAPAPPTHLDSPRAGLRVVGSLEPDPENPPLHHLRVQVLLSRSRSGEQPKSLAEITDLHSRSAHEQELFSQDDWVFIQWLAQLLGDKAPDQDSLLLSGRDLLLWLAQWGNSERIEFLKPQQFLRFTGELLRVAPEVLTHEGELFLGHRLALSGQQQFFSLTEAKFFVGQPLLALVGHSIYLIRNAPPPGLLQEWAERPMTPIRRLNHRILNQLRKEDGFSSEKWAAYCVSHRAKPQFMFELADDIIRLRLLARSERDGSQWQWNGHDWQEYQRKSVNGDKPEILDDPRLEAATYWLRRLDWFTPEPGLWVGDATEAFLSALAMTWMDRPREAEFLGNPPFQRLFLSPRKVKPKLIMKGSGIDWLAVSAEWEVEGMKLTRADLEQLQSATGRFIKLPDSGWLELDTDAVQAAHETMADLGLENLSPDEQRTALVNASQLDERTLIPFGDQPEVKKLRARLKDFSGIEPTDLPGLVKADLRPYQKDGYDFLCHVAELNLGAVLADDMGLGKTLQTLSWLAWLKAKNPKKHKPCLVICPASVLHNWRREAERFTPELKVLVLESGAARHSLRKQIPQHDLIVTNYSLLRRDLEGLQKFDFRALILDEAQYIKNPTAQVTLSVKQLQAEHKLALTGTPLENRLLDLWSIVDFVQPQYLGNQAQFAERYEPKGEGADFQQKIARRRLSARIRPIMLRRLKKQVAKDLPDRIEERRDCVLGDEQRKLYLAELRRSREQVFKTMAEKGLARSKIHVLAALTRLRQICCHPQLVGNASPSGKTETLLELLEPLLAEGQKVLIFSQFVQMLQLIETECRLREIPLHILTGETKQRQDVVNAFQNDPNASVFLLSLRAAGTGLNLTTASYVVLYDPWWNPAVEAQAIDRSHRIGQTRTVNAYRLIAPGTVEEKIWELQQRKAQTIADVLGEEGFARSLSTNDLEYLFSEE